LFVCKYWKIEENANETQSKEGGDETTNGDGDNGGEQNEGEGTIECKLYFWQGRDANQSGWLTFTFSLKKKFKDIEKCRYGRNE
jgi:hypothetical protein